MDTTRVSERIKNTPTSAAIRELYKSISTTREGGRQARNGTNVEARINATAEECAA